MRKLYSLVGAVLAGLLWVGCDRGDDSAQPAPPAVQPPPTTVPAEPDEPTTTPATPAAFLSVGNRMVQFPPAKIRMDAVRGDDHATFLLYSAKPQHRAEEETGNSFYFELKLDVNDFTKLEGATWEYRAPTGERQESPIGIFLDGMRRQLQPYEVLIEFEGAQPPYTVHLNGYFLAFDARDENLPPERIFVSGKLEASIDR